MKETQVKIAKDISKLNDGSYEGWFAQAGAFGNNQCWIYLFIDPSKRLKITDVVADAWGVDLKKFITVSLTFSSLYTDSKTIPSVSCFQSGKAGISKLDGTELNDKSKWGLYWTVENILKQEFFGKFWPLKENYDPKKFDGKNYLYALLYLIEDTVKNCSSRCVICGDKLSFAGIKPVACDKPICVFSYEHFGLGVDIESEIIKHPDIVDLEICLCYAACYAGGSFNPFEPYPDGLETKVIDKISQKEIKYDFKRKDEMDNSKVKECLEKYPSVAELIKLVQKGNLKEELTKLHPLAYPLLRWIIASNRCYLKKIKKRRTSNRFKYRSSISFIKCFS